jgi:hypothetical protein
MNFYNPGEVLILQLQAFALINCFTSRRVPHGIKARFLTPEPAGEPRVPFGTTDAFTSEQTGAIAKASILTAQFRAMPKRDALQR